MTRVFLSYVKEDSEAVGRLVRSLEEYEIDVWIDRNRLLPGQRWADEIRDGISRGDFFLACFSDAYSQRTRSYMNEELTLAIEELRQRPIDRAWFLPVLLSNVEVPARTIGAGETLRSLQWVDLYSNWNAGVARILAVVKPGSNRIHELIQMLESPSARKQIYAADVLRELAPVAKQAIPSLIAALYHENYTVQASAAEALGEIGGPDPEIIAELYKLHLRATVYYSSRRASEALAKFGLPGAKALLDAATKSSGYAVAATAIDSLAGMGVTVVPLIVEAIESGDECAESAESALTHMTNTENFGIIVELLRTRGPRIREAAAAAMRYMVLRDNGIPIKEKQGAAQLAIDSSANPKVRAALLDWLNQNQQNKV
jgi:hypothetical protein